MQSVPFWCDLKSKREKARVRESAAHFSTFFQVHRTIAIAQEIPEDPSHVTGGSTRVSDWLVSPQWQYQLSRGDTAQCLIISKEFLCGPRGTENPKSGGETWGGGFYNPLGVELAIVGFKSAAFTELTLGEGPHMVPCGRSLKQAYHTLQPFCIYIVAGIFLVTRDDVGNGEVRTQGLTFSRR